MINTLQTIERERRPATADEQKTLAKFPGFGPLALRIFPDPVTGDYKDVGWHTSGEKLKALLTPVEYDSAKRTTFNAFYTSPVVIGAIYAGLERLGVPAQATILEPGCGTGNFLSQAPRSAKFIGVEMDSLSGRIARARHPGHDIRIESFRDTKLPENRIDAVVGNVPFADLRLDHKGHKFALHDYFFAKSVDALKPGGVLALVTSHFTLDKQNAAIREYLANQADFVGGIRLPSDAFQREGTAVVTDILFLRKREPGGPIQHVDPDWLQVGPLAVDGADITVNRYFQHHPEMVLGAWSRKDTLYGGEGYSLTSTGDLADQLRTAIERLPQFTKPVPTVVEHSEETPAFSPPAPGSCLFILDSMEKYSNRGLRRAGRVVAELLADERCRHVHILLAMQYDTRGKVISGLKEAGVLREKLDLTLIDSPPEGVIADFMKSVPGVPWAKLHHDMRPLLRNLKILDWVVRAARSGEHLNASRVTGLIPLIDHLWERWVKTDHDGLARSELLKRLAVDEALGSTEIKRLEAIRFPGRQANSPRPSRDGRHRPRRKVGRTNACLDRRVLKAAFSWVDLSSAETEIERSTVIGQVRELLELVLDSLHVSLDGDVDEYEDEFDGLPDDLDEWVFQCVACAIVQMRTDEQPSVLWQPILSLGLHAHRWMERFFWYWFSEGIGAATTPEIFFRRWTEMLQFALESPPWDLDSTWRYHVDEIVSEMLGYDFGLGSMARDERFAPRLEGMAAILDRAAQRWFVHPRVANGFCRSAFEPGYDRILCRGVQWLSRAVTHSDASEFWDLTDFESNLISVLHRCWQRHHETVSTDRELQDAFMGLLMALSAKGSHVAMALKEQIIDSIPQQ